MSVRKMMTQYVGNTLRLPIFGVLEREVNCVVLNPQSEPRAFLPADEAKRLGDENAKLRELVQLMVKRHSPISPCKNIPCGECPVKDECDQEDALMRELGIEVEL